MKIIGLTGGIGSGKSTIAKLFEELGVPVYIADDAGKYLLKTSKVVQRKVINLLGEKAYSNGLPDKKYIANKVFNDTNLLQQLNNIIHPKVGQHFKKWQKKQHAPYCIKEAAILFENGGYKQCDATILVTAPREIRVERVTARDQTSAEEVVQRMSHQWSDDDKIHLADYVIENITLSKTKISVQKLHHILLNL